ncbi:stathmin domain-containing protein 1-like isoform X1 [Sinocyclocheilus rhinocerous]|uniref:Stathmin domain-containing protein 1-like n=2 Tax=Sinocyclocheilus rhinocerous TaxID=307959 RepID=A0A673FSX5_9TELE|nr:PREDICTED: stathmin domain-containing protein 1-like isoform X1 [Sinocyclocheilus rhinocerous]
MGCGSSKITVVEPVKPSSLNGNETETLEFVVAQGGSRGDSAVSKMTTDSGVSLDAAEPSVLPGSVPRVLPPLQAQSPGLAQQTEERPESGEILEQLLVQGIIPAQPRQGGSGEAYNIMMDDVGKPRRRPPARLESLKLCKEQEVTRKEDIEMKMRQVEERRKEKEEDLKHRLRIKSARPRVAAPVTAEGELDLTELLHSEQLPVPTRTKQLQTPINGESEDQRLTDSPELENDSTFQQTEDTDEGF